MVWDGLAGATHLLLAMEALYGSNKAHNGFRAMKARSKGQLQ